MLKEDIHDDENKPLRFIAIDLCNPGLDTNQSKTCF